MRTLPNVVQSKGLARSGFVPAPVSAESSNGHAHPSRPCPAWKTATAWAERGYLTLVPDLSAEYDNGYGFSSFGVRAIQIADAHLDVLSDGSNMPIHVGTGPVPTAQLTGGGKGRKMLAEALLDQIE